MAVKQKFAITLDLEIIVIDTKNYTSKAKPWLASQYVDLVKNDTSYIMG